MGIAVQSSCRFYGFIVNAGRELDHFSETICAETVNRRFNDQTISLERHQLVMKEVIHCLETFLDNRDPSVILLPRLQFVFFTQSRDWRWTRKTQDWDDADTAFTSHLKFISVTDNWRNFAFFLQWNSREKLCYFRRRDSPMTAKRHFQWFLSQSPDITFPVTREKQDTRGPLEEKSPSFVKQRSENRTIPFWEHSFRSTGIEMCPATEIHKHVSEYFNDSKKRGCFHDIRLHIRSVIFEFLLQRRPIETSKAKNKNRFSNFSRFLIHSGLDVASSFIERRSFHCPCITRLSDLVCISWCWGRKFFFVWEHPFIHSFLPSSDIHFHFPSLPPFDGF